MAGGGGQPTALQTAPSRVPRSSFATGALRVLLVVLTVALFDELQSMDTFGTSLRHTRMWSTPNTVCSSAGADLRVGGGRDGAQDRPMVFTALTDPPFPVLKRFRGLRATHMSSHVCTGVYRVDRTCLFRNLLFDSSRGNDYGRWLYLLEVRGGDNPPDAEEVGLLVQAVNDEITVDVCSRLTLNSKMDILVIPYAAAVGHGKHDYEGLNVPELLQV